MFTEHPSFKAPEDNKAIIWRYTDFPKFVDLSQRSALYFTKANLLLDKHEGIFPKNSPMNFDLTFPTFKTRVTEFTRDNCFVNSWTINRFQSAALWSVFPNSIYGIAIQSRYDKFCNSFKKDENKVYVGVINYLDYEIDQVDRRNVLNPFLSKRKSFEYENEIRALITTFDAHKDGKKESPIGILVKVNLRTLIEIIYVSPLAPTWFLSVVANLVQSFKPRCAVIQSDLYYDPTLK